MTFRPIPLLALLLAPLVLGAAPVRVYFEGFTLPAGQNNLATNFGAPDGTNWIWSHGWAATVPPSYLQSGGPQIGSVGNQGGVLVVTGFGTDNTNNWDQQPYFLYDDTPHLDQALGALTPENVSGLRFVATKGTQGGFVARVRPALRFGGQWYVTDALTITGTDTNAFQEFLIDVPGTTWYPLAFTPGAELAIGSGGGTLDALGAAGELGGIGFIASSTGSTRTGSQWRVDDVEVLAVASTLTPAILAQPQPQAVPLGGTATFSVTASAGEPIAYQWRKDGVPIAGAQGAALVIDNVGYPDEGGYDVVLTISTGSTTSATAQLTVTAIAGADRLVTRAADGPPAWIADRNANGLADLLEDALGYEPGGSGVPPAPWRLEAKDGGGGQPSLIFHYTRREPPAWVRPQVEVSGDLQAWTSAGVPAPVEGALVGGVRRELSVDLGPAAAAPLFARLGLRDDRALEELSFAAARDLWLRMLRYYSGVLNANRNRGVVSPFSNDMELVARTLWSLGAWFYHDNRPASLQVDGDTVDLQGLVVDALRNGANPSAGGAWGGGTTGKGNQNIVEAANIAFVAWALGDAHARGVEPAPWDQLSPADRANLHAWLDSNDNNVTGSQQYFDNNWNMFIVLNYEARRQLNALGATEFATWSEPAIEEALRLIQTFNRGGGWFTDDNQDRPEYDDYGPWTIVSHQLFYFMMNPQRVIDNTPIAGSGGVTPRQILADIASFLASQAYLYDADGGHPEWGRSTTYKFARLVSNILAYAIDRQFNTPEGWNLPFPILPESMPPGQLRRMVRLHLNHYLSGEMIDPLSFHIHPRQTRTSGPEVIESYSIEGSTYWAMITFAGLWLIDDDDPFWSAPEAPLPAELGDFAHWFIVPGLLLHHHRDHGHLEAVNLGNSKENLLGGQYARKYEKFVYSSRIGFITRSGPAYDQAIEINGQTRAAPPQADLFFFDGMDPGDIGVGRSSYTIDSRGVSTLIFLKDGAMVRVHRMTGASATVREGGYALGHNTGDPVFSAAGPDWHYFESPHGSAFTQLLLGYAAGLETSGSTYHTRHQQYRLFYGETQNAPDGSVFAILSSGSRGPQDPHALAALVSGIEIDGDRVTVSFADGTQQQAAFR
jgi:hypothetical protein